MKHEEEKPRSTPDGEDQLQSRRELLLGLGKWSRAVIGVALAGAFIGEKPAAGWVNGAWVNRRGAWVNGARWGNAGAVWGNGGVVWGNRGVAWGNRGGAWANRGGGGAWANRGGGGAWVNRRGGGGSWANSR
jgi:hypothetical protein